MEILLTLTDAGADTGPFNLYSNVDGYIAAFETNVPKSSLLAGYTTVNAPNGTTTVRVQSMGLCTNYVDIVLIVATTTTTSSSSSTTTTTTAAPTYSTFVVGMDTPNAPNGWASDTLACAGSGSPLNLYSNPASTAWQDLITNGHALYTDTGLTSAFNGGGLWYKTVTPAGNQAVRIDATGFIDIAIVTC
jgi:hypothetical protein